MSGRSGNEVRLRVLAMLRAAVLNDTQAWEALVPETGEEWAELGMQSLSMLRGALDGAPGGPLAELDRLTAVLVAQETPGG